MFPVTIRSSRKKPPISSVCIISRRSMQRYSVSILKSAIQALDRLDPVLPLSPGREERDVFEYYQQGTFSLFAALNPQSGEVLGKTSARHTSAEFVAFLEQIVARQTPAKEIHIIAATLSAHLTSKVWA